MKNLQVKMLLAAFLMPFIVLAQQFKPVQLNPFGMHKSDTILLQGFAMVDMNKDSLPDLLYTDDAAFNTFMVINQGTIGHPDFDNSPVIDFEDETNGYGDGTLILFPSRLVDLDGDGDADHVYCYSSDDPDFPAPYVVELNEPEAVPSENFDFFFSDETELVSYGIPTIPLFTYESFEYRDITGDGLPDILASRINENSAQQDFVFYRRLTLNSFAPPVVSPFGLAGSTGLYGQPCLLDTDQDGDKDLFVLEAPTGNWLFYKNEGNAVAPLFAAPVTNPFHLTAVPDIGTTAFVIDINQDGRADLMASNFEKFYYFEFNANVSVPTLPAVANVRIYPTLIDDRCHIAVNSEERIDKVMVYDVRSGTTTTLNAAQEIDFQSFATGVYEVVVYLENGSRFSQKVLKAGR